MNEAEDAFTVSHFDERQGEAVLDAKPSAATSAAAIRPLSVNFRAAQAVYNDVERSALSSNDPELQRRIGEGLALCEAALLQVAHQAIFSPNELAEDVNTGDLKYLLLPFYRGELLLRVIDQDKRAEALGEALACLRGFLSDLERLELLHEENRGWQSMGASASANPAYVRTQKIARHKASKAARQRIEELDMLRQIAKMRQPDGSLPPIPTLAEEDKSQGLQMFSLVPDGRMPQPGASGGMGSLVGGGSSSVVQGFRQTDPNTDPSSRLSYATAMRQIHTGEIPGLYTYTVEEGLRAEEATRALGEAAHLDAMEEREKARERAKVEREYGNDEEDEDERQKQIQKDDWKDTHKRGEGNRKNRS